MNLNALIEEYNRQEKSRDWVACVICPLAEEMASRFGMKASVVGPCGLASRVFISLFDTDLEMEGEKSRETIRPLRKLKPTAALCAAARSSLLIRSSMWM